MGLFDIFKKPKQEIIEFYENHPKDDDLAYSLIKEATKSKKEGDLSQAIEHIQHAIKLSSAYDQSKEIKLANYQFENNQIHDAYNTLNLVIRKINHLYPLFAWGQVAEVYHQIGVLKFKEGKYENYIFNTYCGSYFNFLNLSYISDQKHFEEILNRESVFDSNSTKMNKAFKLLGKVDKFSEFDKGFKEFINIVIPLLTEINQYMNKSTRGDKFKNSQNNKRMVFLNDFLDFKLYQRHYKKELKKIIAN